MAAAALRRNRAIRPALRLALLGFAGEHDLLDLLHARRGPLPWEAADPVDADAFWICGAAAELREGDVVRVAGGSWRGDMMLDLAALERPTFFTLPLRDPKLRSVATFDPRIPASVNEAFQQVEDRLQTLALQLALAHEIAARLPELGAAGYQLVRRGEVLAVIALGGMAAVDQRLAAPELARAEWQPLAEPPREAPAGFLRTTFAELLWLYVDRVDADLLPRRYREATVYFRGVPRIAPRLMKDTHYAILSELGAEPQTFQQLQLNVGLRSRVLAQALAALYYAGAVTTSPERASKTGAPRREGDLSSDLPHQAFQPDAAQPFSLFGKASSDEKPTVPSPLEPTKDGDEA